MTRTRPFENPAQPEPPSLRMPRRQEPAVDVRVFDIDGGLMGMPEGGWPGTAQDCGDGKMLVTFAGTSGKFWADDQTWDHDLFGYRRWYRTPEQLANENHRYEVLRALKDQGIVWGPAEWDPHRTVPVTELETLLSRDSEG